MTPLVLRKMAERVAPLLSRGAFEPSASDGAQRGWPSDPSRPACEHVAMRSGARWLATGQDHAPLPGLQLTGYGSSECSLAIARDGTLFLAPAYGPNGNGILRSRDLGKTFEHLVPHFGASGHGREQPHMFLDSVSERLFFHTSIMGFKPLNLAPGFHLTWSDDQGDSWHYVRAAEHCRDWAKLLAGPPVSSRLGDYPNVLYMSAPAPISTRTYPFFAPHHQALYKSLDGGRSWRKSGRISLKPEEVPGASRWEWIIYGNGVVAQDGSVHLGLRRGARFAVASSRDEGETFQVADIPGARLLPFWNLLQVGLFNGNYVIGEPLALDAAGNLYALWPDEHNRLRLSVSRDGARSWSTPVVVSAPDVREVRYGAITARSEGEIAIAYYGSADGKAYHGYIARGTNALDSEPSFWAATVNDPSEPLYPNGFDPGYVGMLVWGGDLNEYLQVKFAPSGDVFAVFCKEMRHGSGPGCWDYRRHASSNLQLTLGRMSFPKT